MRLSRLLILLLLIQFSPAGFSQKKWTLEDCIAYAREHNIRLQQEKLNTALESYDLQHSRAKLLPGVSLSSSQTNRFGRSVDPLTYDFTNDNVHGGSFSAYTNVNLFRGFRGLNQLKKDRLDLEVQLARYDQARLDLEMNITQNFLEMLYLHEAYSNCLRQTELTRKQLAHAEKLFEAGSLTRSALLDLEAQLSQEKASETDAQNQLELSRLSLAQLLDLKNPASFEPAIPAEETLLVDTCIQDMGSLYENSLETIPYIRAARLSLNSAETNLSIAQGYRSPELNMTGGWGTGFSNQITEIQSGQIMSFRDQLSFNSTAYLGFQLALPVFDGLNAYYQVQKAKVNMQYSRLALEEEELRLRKELEMLVAETRAAKANWEAGENSLEAISRSYSDARQRFDLGMMTAVELNNLKNKVSQAESELLVAKYRYIFSTRILRYYLRNNQ